MLKKLVYACVISLSAVGTASAAVGGFYFGPSFGYQTDWSNNVPNVSTVRYQGFDPRLNLGFGGTIADSVYMAVEAWGLRSVQLHNQSQSYPSSVASLAVSWSFGGSALIGYAFDSYFLGFVRLGIADTHFEDLGVWRTGFQGGVGIDYTLAPCWDARVEYDYTHYSNVSIVGTPQMTTFFASLLYGFG